MSSTPQLKMEKDGDNRAVLEIFDDIGPSWAGMIDAKSVSELLKEAGAVSEIEVLINSRGGSSYDGFAIHNILAQHGATIHVRVMGIAASAASIIAMAGDTIDIPKNAMMMIHDPAIYAFGGEKEINSALANLKSTKRAAVATYAAKTGLSEDLISTMMTEETWMTGEEAVAKKFATSLGTELTLPGTSMPVMTVPPFISKAPEQFGRLVALCASVPKEPPVMSTATNPLATPVAQPANPPATPPVPVVATVVAPLLTTADVAKAVSEGVTAERARISEVTNLCKLAGHPELAQKHIDEGTKPADVQTAMFNLLVAERPPVGSTGGPELKTGDDKYKAEFAAHRDVFLSQGIDEARYVNGRRQDDGLPPHPAAK